MQISKELQDLIRIEFEKNISKDIDLEAHVDLMRVPYNHEEILEAVESLISTQVTMGKKVYEFEQLWSNYINSKFTTMVNSGSSANLLALSVLSSKKVLNHIKKGSNVITPALTWSTTVYPIINIGAKPKLIDVNYQDFIVDVDLINEAIDQNTSAIMPVHLLGKPLDMKAIMELAEDNNLWVIEDACEAHGAKVGKNPVGSFGHFSTFSFFFSHHITTIEGGTLSTNDEFLNNLAKSYRAHGWVRERSDKNKIISNYQNIDPRFLFVSLGYNLRPTEIQGGFGLKQIRKLDIFLEKRTKIAEYWLNNLMKLNNFKENFHLTRPREGFSDAWFGFPLLISKNASFDRKTLTDYLEKNKIQTRPIMGGNIARQPVFETEDIDVHNELTNSNYIMDNGIFIGNHQDLRKIDMDLFVNKIDNFLKNHI